MSAIFPEWIDLLGGTAGTSATYIDADTIRCPCNDSRSFFHAGRRLKITGESTGTIYATIVRSTFSTSTDVDIELDSGALVNENYTVWFGINGAENTSSPGFERNVRNFGVVGDGITDDSAAINIALSRGGHIYFPAGTYMIGSGLSATVETHVRLSDDATIFLIDNTNNDTHLFTFTSAASGSSIKGGVLDGNVANNASAGRGINILVNDVHVENVRINNVRLYGIYMQDCNRTRILNCEIYDSSNIGIFFNSTANADISDLEISGCTVDRVSVGVGAAGGGIQVRSNGPTYKLIRPNIRNNRVLMPSGSSSLCIEIWYSTQFVCQGNHCKDGRMGISLAGNFDGVCDGNVIDGSSQYGIENSGTLGCDRTIVSNNTIQNTGTYGIGSVATSPNVGDSNKFIGNNIVAYGSQGILLTNQTNCSVSGNTILADAGSTSHAINIITSDNVSVIDCYLFGNNVATKGILLDDSDNLFVVGTTFKDFTENGVLIFSDSGIVIDNVQVIGCRFQNVNVTYGTQLSGGSSLGSNNLIYASPGYLVNSRNHLLRTISGPLSLAYGTGTPEGVLTAGVGSLYMRTDGGAGTSFYVKESGTGNTGWVGK